MHTQVAQESLNRVVLQVAVPTVHLQAIVNDEEALVGGEFLGHGTVHRVILSLLLDHARTVSHHHAGCFQISGHVSKLELQVLVGSQRRTELLTRLHILGGALNASSSAA